VPGWNNRQTAALDYSGRRVVPALFFFNKFDRLLAITGAAINMPPTLLFEMLWRGFGLNKRVAAMGTKRGGNILLIHTCFLGNIELVGAGATIFTFSFWALKLHTLISL
jgi:hypothetical protein